MSHDANLYDSVVIEQIGNKRGKEKKDILAILR
jgi:hypothetical protein